MIISYDHRDLIILGSLMGGLLGACIGFLIGGIACAFAIQSGWIR